MEFENKVKEDAERFATPMDFANGGLQQNEYAWDDTLIGQKVITEFGHGTVSHIKQFDGEVYCIIALDKSGTLSLPRDTVDQLDRVLEPNARTPEPVSDWHYSECYGERTPMRVGAKVPLRSQSQKADTNKEERKKKMPLPKNAKGGRVPNIMGHIRMYNPTKGWGFVVCTDYEGDVFLHSKHILGNPPPEYIGHFSSSAQGHSVKFDLDLHDDVRPQALNVRMIGGALSKKEDPGQKKVSSGAGPNGHFGANQQMQSVQQRTQDNSWKALDSVTDPLGEKTNGKPPQQLHPQQQMQQMQVMQQHGNVAVQPGDWYCPNPQCHDLQFARNLRCRVCGTPKPGNGRYASGGYPPQQGRPSGPPNGSGYHQGNYSNYAPQPNGGYQTSTSQPHPTSHLVPQGTTQQHLQSNTPAMHAGPHALTPQGYGYAPPSNNMQYQNYGHTNVYQQYLSQFHQPSQMPSQYGGSTTYDSPRPPQMPSYSDPDYPSTQSQFAYGTATHSPPSYDYNGSVGNVSATAPVTMSPSQTQPTQQYTHYDRI